MGARRVALAGSGRGAATFLHRHPTRTNTCVRAPTSRGVQLCPACGSEETCRIFSSKVTDRWPVGAAIRRVVRSANFAIRFFPCNISCVGLLPSWSAYDHTIIRASFSHISLFKSYYSECGSSHIVSAGSKCEHTTEGDVAAQEPPPRSRIREHKLLYTVFGASIDTARQSRHAFSSPMKTFEPPSWQQQSDQQGSGDRPRTPSTVAYPSSTRSPTKSSPNMAPVGQSPGRSGRWDLLYLCVGVGWGGAVPGRRVRWVFPAPLRARWGGAVHGAAWQIGSAPLCAGRMRAHGVAWYQ